MKYPLQLESDFRGERWKVNGQQIMAGVHDQELCAGSCTLHNPSDHPLRGFRLSWNTDRHVFVRHCAHGLNLPDPDDGWHDAVGREELYEDFFDRCEVCSP